MVIARAPVVWWLSDGAQLSANTKWVRMVCCNTATKDKPAYYVYFDKDNFRIEINYDDYKDHDYERMGHWFPVDYFLPFEPTVTAFAKEIGVWRAMWTDEYLFEVNLFTAEESKENYKKFETFLKEHGLSIDGNQYYFSKNVRYNFFGFYAWYSHVAFRFYDYDKDNYDDAEFPYMMIKAVTYDSEWDGDSILPVS